MANDRMSEINNNNDGSNIKSMADVNGTKRKEELKLLVVFQATCVVL
jgi:hypothetical protein